MPATFHSAAGGLWAEQPTNAAADYWLEWDFGPADAIAASEWAVSPNGPDDDPPVVSRAERQPARTGAVLAGGAPGRWYAITNRVETQAGRRDSQTFMLLVGGTMPRGADGSGSGLFPFAPAAVAEVRRHRLTKVLQTHLSGLRIGDDDIWNKLVSAEAEAERLLRVWVRPREILPSHPSFDDNAAALRAAGERVEREPGYDFNPEIFQGARWGLLELRQRPVVAIRWARFAFPSPEHTVLEIPAAWLRPEGRTNRVNIVPTIGAGFTLPISQFVMQALGAGRTMPFGLQVAYRAGLADWRARVPDLAQVVMRLATVALVEDTLPPQSASTSADGLSQSISLDASKLREGAEAKLESMRDALQGVRVVVV